MFRTGVLAIATLLFAAACGGSGGQDATEPPTGSSPATMATVAKSPTARPTFAADSTMGKIVQRGKLVVGVKYDQPGFGLLDAATNEPDGFDVALAKAIGSALGLKDNQVEFVETVSKDRIPYLQEDKADLVIATMTINDERKEQIDFSHTYYVAGQSILVKKDNTSIKSVDDLNGKRVCSVLGSTSEQNLLQRAPRVQLLSLETYAACVDAMNDGHVEAVSTDDIILAGFAAADPGLKLVGGQFTKEPYGAGIKKGQDDFVEFINALMQTWFEDGTWEGIYNTYLGKVEGLPAASAARGIVEADTTGGAWDR